MSLNGAQDLAAVRVGDIENQHPHAAAALAAKRSRENVGTISKLVGHLPDALPGRLRDSLRGGAVAEHHRNRGDRDAAFPSNFSNCYHLSSPVFSELYRFTEDKSMAILIVV